MRTFAILRLLTCAALTGAPVTASAGIVTVPSGLNPGDHYRLAFRTSTDNAITALSSNISDYNAFASAAANAVPDLFALGTTWTVIASTATVNARDNTGTNPFVSTGVPIYRLDGVRVADNNADLWDGTLDAPLFTTPSGLQNPLNIYTGTSSAGTALSPLGSGRVLLGYTLATNSTWIASLTDDLPQISRPMYVISGVLTVVPEPSTFALLGAAAIILAVKAVRRKGHDALSPSN